MIFKKIKLTILFIMKVNLHFIKLTQLYITVKTISLHQGMKTIKLDFLVFIKVSLFFKVEKPIKTVAAHSDSVTAICFNNNF
jgi:hypothetical protein